MRFYVVTDQGSREYMEDRHVAAKVSNSSHVAAVFDGHSGDDVSQYCSTSYAQHLSDALSLYREDDVLAIKDSLDKIDASAKLLLQKTSAGTTACVVMIHPTSIVTANVGDSRAILFSREDGGVTFDLSRDHKPSDPAEHDRILRSGGFVTQPHQTDGVHRVMGRLSLSRALGDWELRPWVSPASDVTVHERKLEDTFVVIATDGIWDVMSSDEVGRKINGSLMEGLKPQDALQRILEESRRRGSGDNVTIVLVDVGRGPLVPTKIL